MAAETPTASKPVRQSHAGFVRVPIGLAGPLRISASGDPDDDYYASLASVEPALIASCSRGCKTLTESNGLRFKVLCEGLARASVFSFDSTEDASAFADRIPAFQSQLATDAQSTSRFARLQALTPHVIGTKVHLVFDYSTGAGMDQDMATIATQVACQRFLISDAARELLIQDFTIERDVTSNEEASQRNTTNTRGVPVLVWGELTNEVCQRGLNCTTERLHRKMIESQSQ